MAHEVSIETVAAEPMAAVAAEGLQRDLPRVIPASLDRVYEVLRAGDYGPLGCNVVWYGPSPPGQPMPLMAGVRLTRPFVAVGAVVPFETPAGDVAHAVYFGPYGEMHPAHLAAQSAGPAAGRKLTGVSWEVYGDWEEDPAKLRTDIYYQLRPRDAG
jgi:effector-binding domain-containing protein